MILFKGLKAQPSRVQVHGKRLDLGGADAQGGCTVAGQGLALFFLPRSLEGLSKLSPAYILVLVGGP